MPPETSTKSRTPSTLTLPSDLEIRVERAFRAPIAKVWRAWTDPTLAPRWMGPAKYEMTTSEFDARDGGKFRWVWPVEGQDLVIHGDVLAIDKPHRIVTREFMEMGEPFPGYTLNFLVFSEQDGKTVCATHMTFANKDARDGALASGMKDGMDEGYDRMDALLKEL